MRFALKRLTPSDLTLFEWQFRNRNAGNQKAINLNADVFVSNLYPTVPAIAPTMNNELPVSLSLYGPEGKPEYKLARKIIKAPSYKNWRLDGEFIRNPDNDPDRFNVLKPDDVALMAFTGDQRPESVSIFLLSKVAPGDAGLHEAFFPLLGNRSMIPLDKEAVQEVVSTSKAPDDHPIRGLLVERGIEAILEDAAFGAEKGARALARRKATLKLSAADLARARAKAEQVGRDGEGLVHVLLESMKDKSEIRSFIWSAETNAVSPYDFELETISGERVLIDVKATEGPFERTIHISAAELAEAAEAKERYDLYRVYELSPEGGKLRISNDIRGFAQQIRQIAAKLPEEIAVDSFSVEPSALKWGPKIDIVWLDDVGETSTTG